MNEKRKYTISELLASWTVEKRAADSLWTRFVLRPLSFPVALLFLSLGWTPNAVTYLSALLCVAAFPLLVVASPAAVYAAFGLLFIFGVLDCADGTMARTRGVPSPFGDWVDALGGYVAYTTILLGIGILAERAYPPPAPLFPGAWALIGGIAASSNLLMRVVYQGYRAVSREDGRQSIASEKKLSENIGITGILVPLSAFGFALGFLPWVVVAYAVVYGGGCLLTILKLIRKVEGGAA